MKEWQIDAAKIVHDYSMATSAIVEIAFWAWMRPDPGQEAIIKVAMLEIQRRFDTAGHEAEIAQAALGQH